MDVFQQVKTSNYRQQKMVIEHFERGKGNRHNLNIRGRAALQNERRVLHIGERNGLAERLPCSPLVSVSNCMPGLSAGMGLDYVLELTIQWEHE